MGETAAPAAAATPAAPISPRQIKNIKVVVGEKSFEKQVNACEYKKSGGAAQTWQGGTPDAQYVDKAPSEFSVDLGLIADWEEPSSLCNFLWENDGEKATLEYQPDSAGKTYFTSEITIDAPMPPGKVGAWPEVTVSCPSTKPVRAQRAIGG